MFSFGKQNAAKASKVQQPMEAIIECKTADDTKKREQHTGCYGFIRAWVEKRSLKKKEKKLKKKGTMDKNFSDIITKVQKSPKFYEADDSANIGLVIDAWEAGGVKRIALN
jgi:hypothetical protein